MTAQERNPLEDLAVRLKDLREKAGDPSLNRLVELTGDTAWPLARSTISDKLSGKSVISWEFVRSFVTACVAHARSAGRSLPPELAELHAWDAIHTQMLDAVTGDRAQERHAKAARDERARRTALSPHSGEDSSPHSGEDSWVVMARDHDLWKLVTGKPGADALRSAAVELTAQASRRRESALEVLRDDPWRDDGLAIRTAERLQFLVGQLGDDLRLDPAEAALLVVMPFVRDAVHAVHAAGAVPSAHAASWLANPLPPGVQKELAAFARNYPALQRRALRLAATGEESASAAIAWWIFRRHDRRMLRLHPQEGAALIDAFTEPVLASADPADARSLPLIREVLAPSRLCALDEAMDGDPGLLAYPDRPAALRPRAAVRAATSWEQHIREESVGRLLMLTSSMAIDPGALGEVIVDHVGTGDSVDLASLLAEVTAASWVARGRSRVLHARCTHQAVGFALREHAAAVDGILRAIHNAAADSADAALLSGLPVSASAEGVRPADAQGRKAYEAPGTRFRLAEDRVLELLMGEQLYGDRSLAIRELYQNSLDACRYRQARTEFLARTGHMMPPWSGRITFDQGVDERGRPYLECADNGIGMGVRDLRDAFSRAGARFTDLPEFIQEQADWRVLDPPITLFPNSRFGIGVLSYFMLAHEIVVTTCRMDRTGRPGERLRVIISGPGALFRIQPLGPGHDAGTTVRLYLHPSAGESSLSCVDLLRRLLWVAEFDTSAQHDSATQTWAAGALSRAAAVGADDPTAPDASRKVNGVHGREGDQVWWCGGTGAILSDGLWAGKTIFGAVVNLTGPNAPTLSVDRRKLLSYDESAVEELMLAAAPSLARIATPVEPSPSARGNPADGPAVGGYYWLSSLTVDHPDVADVIFRELAKDRDRHWTLAGHELPLSVFGCYPADCVDPNIPFHVPEGGSGIPGATTRVSRNSGPYPAVSAWRCAAFQAGEAGASAPVPGPRPMTPVPSDAIAIGDCRTRTVTLEHLLEAAARLRRPAPDVAARLTELGFAVPPIQGGVGDAGVAAVDVRLISLNLDGRYPWLPANRMVARGHLIHAAVALRTDIADITSRLRTLGFATPDVTMQPGAMLTSDDVRLVSPTLEAPGKGSYDSARRWLPDASPVRLDHLINAAARLEASVPAIAARLRDLGFDAPDTAGFPDKNLTQDDARLISRDLNGAAPWLPLGKEVSRIHLLRAAAMLGQSAAAVASRLVDLGLRTVPTSGLTAGEVTSADVRLISRRLDGLGHWLHDEQRVSRDHVLQASAVTQRSSRDVATRLQELGFRTPDLTGLPDKALTAGDARLISRDLSGRGPWLPGDQPVPRGHLVRAAAQSLRSVPRAAARLRELGYVTADTTGLPDEELTESDAHLMTSSLDGDWLPYDRTVPMAHLVRKALREGHSILQVAERLRQLGFTVPARENSPIADLAVGDRELIVLRPEDVGYPAFLDEEAELLREDQPVPWDHIVGSAVRLRRSIPRVASRLRELGFTVPDTSGLPDIEITEADAPLISKIVTGNGPWLRCGDEIPVGHLLNAAAETGRAVSQVTSRLSTLGFTVPDAPDIMGYGPAEAEARLTRASSPQASKPVFVLDLVRQAARALSSVPREAARLRELGYIVPATEGLPDSPVTRDDERLLINDPEAHESWLTGDRPVTQAQIVRTAARVRSSVPRVGGRLRELGFKIPDIHGLPDIMVTRDDVALIVEDPEAHYALPADHVDPLLPDEKVNSPVHLVRAATRLEVSVQQVAMRLAALGFAPRLPGLMAPLSEWLSLGDQGD